MRFRGQPIEIRDRRGRVHRGIRMVLIQEEEECLFEMALEEEDLFPLF